MTTFALDSEGYFTRRGKRVVPVGFNYWPASSGVEMWRRWSPGEIMHDLDVMRANGLNTIRFFLRWEDFEPVAGEYDQQQFDRLTELLGWCRERGLWAHPSLFVGWMSGGISWPTWRGERNVFADEFMRRRALEFARKASSVIAPFAEHVLAIDLGNELDCLPDAGGAAPAAVIEWCRQVNAAIRESCPQFLIISGTSHGALIWDNGWRLGQQPGCDLYSMHSYPVSAWHQVRFDGLTDPFAHSILPSYIRVARTFGPVFMQEFGTVNCGPRQSENYLRRMLPAAWEAGANGFLFWCLRDISARVAPYLTNGFEGTLGMFDENDRVKPGLEYFVEFARSRGDAAPPRPSPKPVGIYFPEQYYDRDITNAHNHPQTLAPRMLLAQYGIELAGAPVRIVRGPIAPDLDVRALLICGAVLNVPEAEHLAEWVFRGGRLLWHGPDPFNWGPAYARLVGAQPVDFRAPATARVEMFNETWEFGSLPRNIRVEVEMSGARALAADSMSGQAQVLSHQVGRGRVITTLAIPEDAMITVAGQPEARDRWSMWYRGMVELIDRQ